MAKSQPSKLDQYADTLAAMEAEKKTLAEMVAWLAEEGCVVDGSTVSRFLSARRSEAAQARVLTDINTGARMHTAVRQQFAQDGAPELETLLNLHKVLVMQLATAGTAAPEMLKLADQCLRTVMEGISAKTKAEIKQKEISLAERRVELLEKKGAAFDRAQAALAEAKQSKGGITPETMSKIEAELKLL